MSWIVVASDPAFAGVPPDAHNSHHFAFLTRLGGVSWTTWQPGAHQFVALEDAVAAAMEVTDHPLQWRGWVISVVEVTGPW